MAKNRMQELGKKRVAEVRMADIFNGAVIGIIALWSFWFSSTVLIRFVH